MDRFTHISAGGLRHRVGRFWLPDGLHIWLGSRGVHLYWKRTRHEPSRVIFERAVPSDAS